MSNQSRGHVCQPAMHPPATGAEAVLMAAAMVADLGSDHAVLREPHAAAGEDPCLRRACERDPPSRKARGTLRGKHRLVSWLRNSLHHSRESAERISEP